MVSPVALDVRAGRGQLLADLRGQLAAQRVEVGAAGDLAAVLVDHAERDGQVLGQPVSSHASRGIVHAAHPAQLALEAVEQRLVAGRQPGEHGPGVVGRGGELPAQRAWAAS